MTHLEIGARGFALSPLALAAALVMTLALPVQAQTQFFSSSGANDTTPVDQFPINPAAPMLDYTGNRLNVVDSAPGSFSAMAGVLKGVRAEHWERRYR